MPTGITIGGIDLELLFDPDTVGDGPTVPSLTVGGVPVKFANIAYGSLGVDTRVTEGGVDIKNKWAAAGTAAYIDPDALPTELVLTATGSSPQTSSVGFNFNRNGSMSFVPSSYEPRDWRSPNVTDIGDDYEIRFTLTDSSGPLTGVAFTGDALGIWHPITTSRGRLLEYTRTVSGSATAFRELLVELRRIGTTTTLFTHTLPMMATSDIS